ncbi:MAG: hypothetical protein ACI9EF_001282, partial [Pseudohongiellaceae bacterium]
MELSECIAQLTVGAATLAPLLTGVQPEQARWKP